MGCKNGKHVPLPPLESRLQARYLQMVNAHGAATQALACGIHALPDTNTAFAATQAAYRFLKNPHVTLRALADPLLEVGRQEVAAVCDSYVLVAHDWSQLMYAEHDGKPDRVALSSRRVPEGYELQSALLVSDHDGAPLAPAVLRLRAADGVHCSHSWKVRAPLSPLDELAPAMAFVESLSLARPAVHIIDAEADSVAHFREWSEQPGRFYLVRADDRIVEHQGCELRCSAIKNALREEGAFGHIREVEYHGHAAQQWVAEAPVRLLRAGQRNRPGVGDRQKVPGPPLPLRLVIAEVRDSGGQVLATWYLLTNVPTDADPSTIALWYYWRWRIESFFKLLKSAGMNVEQWQQESASAIAKRLLVASMACVVIWRLARSQDPRAEEARNFLVRLSGRQIKRTQKFTMPALLAGMWVLLAMMEALESYSPEDLRELARFALGRPPPNDT
jgi:Transposase DDE domain